MRVTLDIFSGTPNPSWMLNERDTRLLLNRLAGKAMLAVEAVPGLLGYRGFLVDAESDDAAVHVGLPDTFRLGAPSVEGFVAPEGLALPALTASEADDAGLWLLTTAQKAVDDDLLQYAEGAIRTRGKPARGPKEQASRAVRERAVGAACIIQNTAYNPGFWNRPSVQPYNNCYNYAMNWRSDTFAQPGRISGHLYSGISCAAVGTAANWDGCKTTCSGGNKQVALVIWPGRDYHWYRKHSNGFWGHKPGSTAARNTDNRGRVIGGTLTPQNCDRGPYTTFCGYRYSPTGMRVR